MKLRIRDTILPDIYKSLYRIIHISIALILSAIIFILFIAKGITGFPPALFSDMVYGKASKPYVYRTLLPTTARILTSVIPSGIKAPLRRFLNENHIVQKLGNKLFFAKVQREGPYLIEYIISLALMYLSLIGFLWSIRYLFKSLYAAPVIFADIVPLMALAGIPCFFKYHSYLYDFPALFLFTLGLGLMVNKKWNVFYPVFILACLNKETAVFLTMICAVHYWRSMNPPLLKKLLISQLLIFLFIKSILTIVFMHNAGTLLQIHLLDHNLQIFNLYPLKTIILWMGILLAVMAFTLCNWSDKPDFLRHGLWICLPLFFFSIFFGFIDELRIYYEVYPIIILMLYHAICTMTGFKLKTA